MKVYQLLFASILSVLILSNISEAQVRLGIGIRGGLNFGTISIDPEFYNDPSVSSSGSMGFLAGAVLEAGFGNMFAAELEPKYILKAKKYEQGSAKQTISVTELEIPLHAKVKIPAGVVTPYFIAGPNLGIVLTAKSKLEGTQADGETDLKSTTSSTDFGIDFGGGAEFKIASSAAITLDARYSLGLSNLNNDPAAPNQTAKTRGFQVIAGVLFFI